MDCICGCKNATEYSNRKLAFPAPGNETIMSEESEHNVSGSWVFFRIVIIVGVLGAILFAVNIIVSLTDTAEEPPISANGLTELERDCINLNFAGVEMGFEPLTIEDCEKMFEYMYESGWIPTAVPEFQSAPVPK